MSKPQLNDWEADVLAHTSSNGRYVTDEKRVIALAGAGLLKDYGPQPIAGGMHYLTLTGRGRTALEAWRAGKPKPKRMKRRSEQLNRWREFVEAQGKIPFGQFVKEVWPVRYAAYR